MANRTLQIVTPRGAVFQTTGKNGAVKVELVWATEVGVRMTRQLLNTQDYVDSEVLRLSSPYLPFDTGMLHKSGILGTVVGSGEVRWIAPYAARLYYNPQYSFRGRPMRGGMWFERMKAARGREIVAGAKRIGGGGA